MMPTGQGHAGMELGIFAKIFKRPQIEQSFAAAHHAGFSVVHYDFSMNGGPILPERLTAEEVEKVRRSAVSAGVAICSVEGTYNMAHPDPRVRAQGRSALDELISHVQLLGTSLVGLCTGTRADYMWRQHPENTTKEAWNDMRESVEAAVRTAEQHGVTLCIECELGNVVSSAPLARRLLDEIASPALAVTLDAANLIPRGGLQDQARVLTEAFELLGGDIVLAHAKDVTGEGKFVGAGKGGLDYPLFMRLLAGIDFEGILVLHSLPEDEVPTSTSYVQASIDAALADRPAATRLARE
jgi:sugar phosphate isomerase/epimerase